MLKSILRGLGDAPNAYTLQEGTHTVQTESRPAHSFPSLATECTRHFVSVVLDERSNTENLGIAVQDRFNTAEFPELMSHIAGSTDGLVEAPSGARGRDAVFKHHWAWYLPREWATIQQKLALEAVEKTAEAAAGPTASGAADAKVCTDIRFDGIGELQIVDDELGSEETQLRVLGMLYVGVATLTYHCLEGDQARARILHVQGVDGTGAWQDPTICKLSPKDLLRAEADAHAVFSRFIGESVPQRIGEPVFVEEVGGMVLELVGACWRMPELAHTQATLSNTFAEVCKYDSDHAAESALAHDGARPPRLRRGADRHRRGHPRPARRGGPPDGPPRAGASAG